MYLITIFSPNFFRHRGCQWGLDGRGHRLVFKTRRQFSICLAYQRCHLRFFGGKRANYFVPSRHHSSYNGHLHWKAAGRRQTSRLPLRLNQDLIRDKLVTLFTMANKKQKEEKKKENWKKNNKTKNQENSEILKASFLKFFNNLRRCHGVFSFYVGFCVLRCGLIGLRGWVVCRGQRGRVYFLRPAYHFRLLERCLVLILRLRLRLWINPFLEEIEGDYCLQQ